MAFAYPSQRLQDWLSQQWVIALGRRIEPAALPWLTGPYGMVDTIADSYLPHLAANEGLELQRAVDDAGLFLSVDELGLEADARRRLHPDIAELYERTTDFELEMWVMWPARIASQMSIGSSALHCWMKKQMPSGTTNWEMIEM